jgi:hypothetical protein
LQDSLSGEKKNLIDFMRMYLIAAFALLMFACNKPLDAEYIKSKIWTFQGGYKIGKGDFMIFDANKIYKLKNDTIFYLNEPKALIIQLDKTKFTLKVKSLNGQQTGAYMDLEDSFE